MTGREKVLRKPKERPATFYRVGWFCATGDSQAWVFVHEREFSREEFTQLVNSILIDVFKRALRRKSVTLMDDAMYEVAKILNKKHGFEEPRVMTMKYDWPLMKRIEWAVDSRLRAAIPPDLLEKVLQHNERAWPKELKKGG